MPPESKYLNISFTIKYPETFYIPEGHPNITRRTEFAKKTCFFDFLAVAGHNLNLNLRLNILFNAEFNGGNFKDKNVKIM
jgi:hypothetical protein